MVLAPEHPFVKDITSSLARSHPFGLSAQSRRLARLKDYVERSKKKTEQERIAEGKEKTGVFTGFYCINPVNNQKVPIWVADYVIATYGTGAVMGVPGSDHRDFAFARKYKLPIIRVIGKAKDDLSEVDSEEKVLEEGILVNSQQFSGMPTPNPARDKIKDFLEERGFGKRKNQYHLRDWLISRQRYWGPPIPMIYCEKCASEKKGYFEVGSEKRDAESLNSRNQDIKESKSRIPHFSHQESPMYGWFPVPEENLPVLLPDVKDWRPKGTGKSPLASLESFVNTKCPNCGGNAVRETDVSDTFLDSSWYFLRYLATDRNDIPFPSLKFQLSVLGSQLSETGSSVVGQSVTERQKTDKLESENRQQKTDNRIKWLPVNMYIGGAEHSVLHLLYVRFLTMVFHDLGLIDFDEPFPRFYAHGLLIKEGGKMSKSKGNVVVPDEYIKKYGADTLRTYLMFLGPFSQGGDFYDNSISGVYRFLGRVYKLVSGFVEKEHLQSQARSAKENVEPAGSQIAKKVHQTIKKVTNDMEALRFNTAIAAQMELLNTFYLYQKALKRTDLEQMLLMLAPFAPHITEELWQRLRFSVFSSRLSVPSQSVISQSVTEKQKTGKQKSENRQQKTDNWSIHLEPWPTYDPKLLEEEEVTVVVQINGKVRDNFKFQISNFKFQNKVEEEALKREKVKKHLDGKKIKRVVYVAGKIINFVVG
ncbi:class I tRNA ligase family protein [Candidatus Microgenomates bacterium]|nr:class I tRNA ligase family protein [Candidatus Microgenomates bacterium]